MTSDSGARSPATPQADRLRRRVTRTSANASVNQRVTPAGRVRHAAASTDRGYGDR
ncbi:hypothetical protein [Haloarcula salinisoli]|uniref:Uncharacterized protein n=1 Tax=Haloarcula salinisoli TaxID=2487746 RepID=A0A8J7YJE0_9EURY|nr:hypothetical protein [Halomicroarcula salinisoli]MBX0286193.1 hypothetical protein [Halomicroarcula salinisoli]MBX0302318.1 hypothetical protein [Halomicroarcula salinisoli]